MPNTKKRAGVAQVAEFKPQYHQKYLKKKKKKKDLG
jgi:hypothetical protein